VHTTAHCAVQAAEYAGQVSERRKEKPGHELHELHELESICNLKQSVRDGAILAPSRSCSEGHEGRDWLLLQRYFENWVSSPSPPGL
jgi:hypothetical protein